MIPLYTVDQNHSHSWFFCTVNQNRSQVASSTIPSWKVRSPHRLKGLNDHHRPRKNRPPAAREVPSEASNSHRHRDPGEWWWYLFWGNGGQSSFGTYCCSSWYNCTGWLGVKHQLTYLLSYMLSCTELSHTRPNNTSAVQTVITSEEKCGRKSTACLEGCHGDGMLAAARVW